MKGGGLEGVSSATYLFWKMIFLKTIYNHSLTVKTCFALSLGFILCIYSCCFALSLGFISCIYSSWGDFEHVYFPLYSNHMGTLAHWFFRNCPSILVTIIKMHTINAECIQIYSNQCKNNVTNCLHYLLFSNYWAALLKN